MLYQHKCVHIHTHTHTLSHTPYTRHTRTHTCTHSHVHTRTHAALQVRDLCRLACACQELRRLADADFQWKPRFLRDWPRAGINERSLAERRGYKAAYLSLRRVRGAWGKWRSAWGVLQVVK